MPQVPLTVLDLCRPDIKSLPIYNAGISESAARAKYSLSRVTKLASNENPFGASPAALDALRHSAGRIYRYPDPECTALREEIHRRTGVPADRILFGNGSENIIELLCQALLAPGDRVVTLAPSFGLHEIFPLMMGATVDKVPVNGVLQHDLAAWRDALSRPAKLVMFSTPSNPAGCVLSTAQLQEIVDAAPRDAVLVVDEAYHEYAGTGQADSLQVLGAQHRPWMVLRTLSKAYGLAALRIGYGMASGADFVSILHKVRTPFNVNHAAQVAALAALKDTDHLQAVVSATVRERGRLLERLKSLDVECGYGLRLAASQANFLFMDTSRPSREVAEAMMRRGVIVKPWLEPGFDTFIRVTVGPSADNGYFIGAFREAMAEIRAV
jgi:histidinol-phosphate aminotransferase